MSSVVFDYDAFLARFPHIATAVTEGKLTEDAITEAYNGAAQWLGADDSTSLYPYDPDKGVFTRRTLLYLATCHLLTMGLWPSGQGGRVVSASQGSVSTSFDLFKVNSEIGQWWTQTPCGAQFWVMTAAYRKGGRLYGGTVYHPWG